MKKLLTYLFGTKQDARRTINNIRYVMSAYGKDLKGAFMFEAEPKCAVCGIKPEDEKQALEDTYKLVEENLKLVLKLS